MFHRQTVEWLLEPAEPSVRYFTLKYLLDKPEDDPEVLTSKAMLMSVGPVADILSRQNADGGFLTRKMGDTYGEAVALTGYQPKYKATTWQLLFLAQLGADGEDTRVKRLCEYVLDKNYSPEYGVLGIDVKWPGSEGTEFRALPCFVANMVWALSTLGYHRDSRVQDSLKWLLHYQRFDDGDFKTPDEWPYRGKKDRCFGRHTCFSGVTRALKAMTVVPSEERTAEMQRFIDKATEFILLHRLYRRNHGTGRPIRVEFTMPTFPLVHYDDLISVVDTLQQLSISDPAIDETLALIRNLQTPEGRWKMAYTMNRSSTYASFGTRGKESKWITLRALKVLKTRSGLSRF